MNETETKILQYLTAQNCGWKASEIANELGINKSTINKFLYDNLDVFEKNDKYYWFVKNQAKIECDKTYIPKKQIQQPKKEESSRLNQLFESEKLKRRIDKEYDQILATYTDFSAGDANGLDMDDIYMDENGDYRIAEKDDYPEE